MSDEFEYILNKTSGNTTVFFLNPLNEIKGSKIEEKNPIKKRKVNYKNLNITYDEYKTINTEHTKYVTSLLKDIPKVNRIKLISTIELAGAELYIKSLNNPDNYSSFPAKGFVVEERESVLVMIFDDNKIRIIPKNQNEFLYEFDGVRYIFLRNLNKKRHFKMKVR